MPCAFNPLKCYETHKRGNLREAVKFQGFSGAELSSRHQRVKLPNELLTEWLFS